MALISVPVLTKLLYSKTFFFQIRNSVWPSMYISPIVKRSELNTLQKEEPEKYNSYIYCPVKAASNSISDSVFCDPILTKFVNSIMIRGKKALAQRLLRDVLYEIKKHQLTKYYAAKDEEERAKIELNAVTILKIAIDNCSPVLKTIEMKRGGVTYQVPFPISKKHSLFLSLKWLREASRDRPKPKKELFPSSMCKQILNAYNMQGSVIKKKHDLHKLCEANRAYAHYRWG